MRRFVLVLAALTVFSAAPLVSRAQVATGPRPSGEGLFKTYCGSCHGKSGKGDGPLADALRVRPPDLTLLAGNDGGNFDADAVRRIIDGRDPLKGHGGGDMPVWGDAFQEAVGRGGEEEVRQRIDSIVEHLRSIQAR